MADPTGRTAAITAPESLTRALAEIVDSVAADAGAAVYLPDADGTLHLAAEIGTSGQASAPWSRLFRRDAPRRRGVTALVPIPDANGGLLVLARRGTERFSRDDLAVARMFARRLARDVVPDIGLAGATTRWSRQLEAIQRIAAQLARLASLEDVGLAICSETKQVIDYDNCRVYVVDRNGVDLTPVALRGEPPHYDNETVDDLRCRVGEAGEGLTGLVAARGEPLLIRDASIDPRAIDVPRSEDLHESMLLVPMRYEGRVTGVIVLVKLGVGQFDHEDLRLLQILSDQAAVAVENARLLAGRDQLVGELAALLDISASSALASDEVGLAAVLARKLRDAVKLDGCIISRWEEGTTLLHTVASTHPGDDLEPAYDILDYPATRQVLREGRPLVVHAGAPDADGAEVSLMRQMAVSTLLMLPLVVAGKTIGLVELVSRGPRDFTEYELDFCLTMANQAGAVLENARLVDQLRRAADVDQVTGVNNHRYLQERLKQELARSGRARTPLAVLMIDLDGFKGVNDRFGHADGDKVLRSVAAGIKLAVRTNDIVARYGGDEFVVLMPDTPEAAARVVAERVVAGIRNRRHTMHEDSEIMLGASAGLAVYPDDARTPQALLRQADAAMYAVKRSGGSAVRRAARGSGGPAVGVGPNTAVAAGGGREER